jgi:hypothetical protein
MPSPPRALAIGSPALATGKMTCNAGPQSKWKSRRRCRRSLEAGLAGRKSKVDGGCYEVYGTTQGNASKPISTR